MLTHSILILPYPLQYCPKISKGSLQKDKVRVRWQYLMINSCLSLLMSQSTTIVNCVFFLKFSRLSYQFVYSSHFIFTYFNFIPP